MKEQPFAGSPWIHIGQPAKRLLDGKRNQLRGVTRTTIIVPQIGKYGHI